MERRSFDSTALRRGLVSDYKFITLSMEQYLEELVHKNYEYLIAVREDIPNFKDILEGLSVVLVEAKRIKMEKERTRNVEFSEASNELSDEDVKNFSYDILLLLYESGLQFRNLNNDLVNQSFENVW